MCTAITMQTTQGDVLFGRTMDFSYDLDPELYVVPKGYTWNNILNTHRIKNLYSFMGIGQNISPIAFADGVNEMGLSAAVLYFPGFAQYDPDDSPDSKTPAIAAIELVQFILGLCASVKDVASILRTIRIIGIKDSVTDSIAPLHWIVADKSGSCMAVERTASGLNLIDNPIGVLSNSPDFQWHMTNLRNYMNLTPSQQQEAEWGNVKLTPFGQGAGSFGLPGDYTPPSRFVRASYLKSHIAPVSSREEAITACFHIMESVSIPKGVVITARDTSDYTQYIAFTNISTMEYFFKTYDNSQIITVPMPSSQLGGAEIVSLGKITGPNAFGRHLQEKK